MRNIFKLLTAFSLCCLNTGLNADAMEPVPQEKFSMIDNPNNVDLTKIGVSKGIPNKLSNKEFSMIDNPNNVDLTKIGIPSSNAIKTNNDKIDIPQKTSNDGEPAIKLDYPFNLLVVADSEDRMKKVTSLLCNNNLSLSLGDLKNLQDLNYYKSGGIYPAVNNPNINVLCITLDDFINDSFNYDWDFICQNTTKIFYTFGWDSDNAEKYFDTLKKFYHKFNKHWCGKDLDYADNYDSYGKQISENDFKGPVLKKGKNDWFEYVRTKRNLFNHRYIFFLLDSDKIDYSFDFGQYVANMPDARSITLCKLEDELCIKPLINLLFTQSYEGFQKVKPFLEILEKQEKNWSPLKIGLITVGGIGAIGTVAAISSLIKKNLSTKPKITKPEVKNQEIKNPGNNKLLT